MYTFRKPKTLKEALELIKASKVKPTWDINHPDNVELSENYFALYSPIVFIYKHNKLIGLAHGKFGAPEVIDIHDAPANNKYTKDNLNDIDIAIRQIELF